MKIARALRDVATPARHSIAVNAHAVTAVDVCVVADRRRAKTDGDGFAENFASLGFGQTVRADQRTSAEIPEMQLREKKGTN